MQGEGYIKFNCNWKKSAPLPEEAIQPINRWRDCLFSLKLIGSYPDGTGYGNLSVRHGIHNQFIITGTQTGGLEHLNAEHYSFVADFYIPENLIICKGPVMASSESLTHAVIYEEIPEAGCVMHAHHTGIWEYWKGKAPTTGNEFPCGTLELAEDLRRVIRTGDSAEIGVFILGGHPEGIVITGKDLGEAERKVMMLLRHLEIVRPKKEK